MFTLILWLLNNKGAILFQKTFNENSKTKVLELFYQDLKRDESFDAEFNESHIVTLKIVPTQELQVHQELKIDDASYLLACSAYQLNERYTDIAMLLRDKLSNKEIAGKLFIGSETVKSHISKMFQIMDAGSRELIVEKLKTKARTFTSGNS